MRLKSADTLVLLIITVYCLVKIWQLKQSQQKSLEKSFNYSAIGDYCKSR